jgi:hypothetical protein
VRPEIPRRSRLGYEPPLTRHPAAVDRTGRSEAGSVLSVVVIVEVDGVRVAQGPQPVNRLGGGEAVTAEHVEVSVIERGEPGDVLVPYLVAPARSRATAASMYRVVQSTTALRTRPSDPSWSSMPSRYAG